MTREPDPAAVVSQVMTYTDKLTEALGAADDLGGLGRLRGSMRPATAARISERLTLLRAEIDEQLAALDRPAPRPARRPLLRRQANRPDPIPTTN